MSLEKSEKSYRALKSQKVLNSKRVMKIKRILKDKRILESSKTERDKSQKSWKVNELKCLKESIRVLNSQIVLRRQEIMKSYSHQTQRFLENKSLEKIKCHVQAWWQSRGKGEINPGPENFRDEFLIVSMFFSWVFQRKTVISEQSPRKTAQLFCGCSLLGLNFLFTALVMWIQKVSSFLTLSENN